MRPHLCAGGVGRIVFSTDRGSVALPVNFDYSNGNVVISTDVAKADALESQHTVSFEIDRIDDVMSEGWSVLVTGRLVGSMTPTSSLPCVAGPGKLGRRCPSRPGCHQPEGDHGTRDRSPRHIRGVTVLGTPPQTGADQLSRVPPPSTERISKFPLNFSARLRRFVRP